MSLPKPLRLAERQAQLCLALLLAGVLRSHTHDERLGYSRSAAPTTCQTREMLSAMQPMSDACSEHSSQHRRRVGSFCPFVNLSEGLLLASSGGQHEGEGTHLLGAAFKHLLIVLAISPAQVGLQPLRRLIGQLDAVLQQADGQGPLKQRRRLSRKE